ncbi:MAG: hypothetical protein ABI977_33065 [Acidobacteriota bacterium]
MSVAKQRWQPSPPLVVSVTAVGVLALFLALNWIAVRRGRVNAHVEIADPVIENIVARTTLGVPAKDLPDGEVERTAARVRDASALTMGLTLFAVNEGLNRRAITNVGTLVGRFAARSLLPPGVRQNTAPGVLESERAMIYVRYRPEPLAIEILSVGRERLDGPALIGRIAAGGDEDAGASLFIARGLGDVLLPDPFTPAARMTALNWSLEPLRDRAFTPQEMEQINGWLQAQRGGLGSP